MSRSTSITRNIHQWELDASYSINPGFDGIFNETEELEVPAVEEQVKKIQDTIEVVKKNLAKAQIQQKKNADVRRREHRLKVVDLVFASASHIKPQSGVIELPKSWKAHNAFHVSLLKLANKNDDQKFPLRSSKPPPEPEIQENNTVEYEVEKFVDHRKQYGKMQFRVRGKGYGSEEDRWEPTASLRNASQILKAYKNSVRHEIQFHHAQVRTEQQRRRRQRMVNRDRVEQSLTKMRSTDAKEDAVSK